MNSERYTQEPRAINLTPRLREVAALVSEGLTIEQIGLHLGISRYTAKFHITKLGEMINKPGMVNIAVWWVTGGKDIEATPAAVGRPSKGGAENVRQALEFVECGGSLEFAARRYNVSENTLMKRLKSKRRA